MKKKILLLSVLIVTSICSYLLGSHNGKQGRIKLEECIPLEDIACWYIDGFNYPAFSLKDITHQLDRNTNASYAEITSKLENATEIYDSKFFKLDDVVDCEITENGFYLYMEDGNIYYWEN